MPVLQGHFPSVAIADFANHSSTWSDDHVRMLGSGYTSRPFQPPHSIGWGHFVFAAYEDVNAANVR